MAAARVVEIPPEPEGAERPLEGWKDIAAFIGKSERTARYYGAIGAPIYRRLGRIIAMPSELRRWLALATRPVMQTRFRPRRTRKAKGPDF